MSISYFVDLGWVERVGLTVCTVEVQLVAMVCKRGEIVRGVKDKGGVVKGKERERTSSSGGDSEGKGFGDCGM